MTPTTKEIVDLIDSEGPIDLQKLVDHFKITDRKDFITDLVVLIGLGKVVTKRKGEKVFFSTRESS